MSVGNAAFGDASASLIGPEATEAQRTGAVVSTMGNILGTRLLSWRDHGVVNPIRLSRVGEKLTDVTGVEIGAYLIKKAGEGAEAGARGLWRRWRPDTSPVALIRWAGEIAYGMH